MKNISRIGLVALCCVGAMTLAACKSTARTDAAASATEVKACEKGEACCKKTGKACAEGSCASGSSCSKDAGACTQKKN
ncbi:MAG: hypothetical protein IBJ18_05340 [Phycisphaerales bacterium]|nr:hypothetical protein [Phycisphaerales bacterium]